MSRATISVPERDRRVRTSYCGGEERDEIEARKRWGREEKKTRQGKAIPHLRELGEDLFHRPVEVDVDHTLRQSSRLLRHLGKVLSGVRLEALEEDAFLGDLRGVVW